MLEFLLNNRGKMLLSALKSERPHISFFGRTNAGKSSVVNCITNQKISLVSDVKGTTTDAVQKTMEILPLGPVVIIDTAGIDDDSELGLQRVKGTKRVLDKTDIAVIVIDSTVGLRKEDNVLIQEIRNRKIPYIVVYNKCDLTPPPLEGGGRGWGKTATQKYDKNTQINAIELRNKATKQEKNLWKYLNKSQLGYKFRRQQPIGHYVVDFFCPTLNLVIEIDGGQHNTEEIIEYDKKRSEFLNKCGYRVLRIWNNDIDNNIEGVIEYIKMNLVMPPPPNPLPQGAGGNGIVSLPTLSENPQRFVSSSPESQGAGENGIVSSTDSHSLYAGEVYVSAKTGYGINELKETLGHIINKNSKEKYIIRDRLKAGDVVILVIPIDESAPKGRIILPQQNVLREILDSNSTAICCQVNELKSIMQIVKTPKYVITDSQVFNKVKEIVSEDIILTSFSILMANYKGNITELVNGAKQISLLKNGDIVLISEGCTHHRQCNDIGTVKLPKWIKEYTQKDINFEFTQGGEFPTDLSKYSLIVHCGGCMLNEAEMQSRIKKAKEQNIPIVNYGMIIAHMNGIWERALKIFD